jgi:signal transduction histidine kinase
MPYRRARNVIGALDRLFLFPASDWAAAFRDGAIRRLVYLCLAVGLLAACYGVLSSLAPPQNRIWLPSMLTATVVIIFLSVLRWGFRAVAIAAPVLSVTFAIAVTSSTVGVLFQFPVPVYSQTEVIPAYMGTFTQWTPVFFMLNTMWFRPAGARVINLATTAGVLVPCAAWLLMHQGAWIGDFDTDAVAMNFFVLSAGLLAQETAFAVRERRAMRLSAARQSLLDLRRRRIVERELRDARADIARLNRVSIFNAMASTVAHEVKQPLAAASNFAGAARNWLGRSPPELERAKASLAGLEAEVMRARDVIEEIRAMTSRSDMPVTEINVEALLGQTLALIRQGATAQGVRLEARIAPNLPRIPGRPVQLQQVLLNLASNAFEAFDGSTPPVLSLSADPATGGGVAIVVADNGPGILESNMASVQRGMFSTKSSGSGLGVIICRQIVEGHGGVFELVNTGAGVRATLLLPGYAPTEPGAAL